jgi:transposase
MYITRNPKRVGDRRYDYYQICQSYRNHKGQPRRRVLGSLGRVDQVDVGHIDSLIQSLKRLASPEVQLRLETEVAQPVAVRGYGPALVADKLWRELGLPGLIGQGAQSFDVQAAILRLVVNRLIDPRSKLSTVEWQDTVEWPTGQQVGRGQRFDYEQLLRAMDVLLPHKERMEEQLLQRVSNLFSLPLRLVWYDLTSSYCEGNGVCELAAYGYSRDHRPDRCQVVLGLALTQEGFPIAHEVLPGNTADVSTVAGLARSLKARFELDQIVLVGDRGLLSAANAAQLQQLGMSYVMALRTRQHARVGRLVQQALGQGLARPRQADAPWSVQEVDSIEGVRHVVVYSALRAIHDRAVRAKRLRAAWAGLGRLQAAVEAGRVRSPQHIIERASRTLREHKVQRYIDYRLAAGGFEYRLRWDYYRDQRRKDGIFVLVTNDPLLTSHETVAAYRQLMEVEHAFRLLKSLVKMRPMYHWAERRVKSHVFICVVAYLLAKVLEQRLELAGIKMSAAKAVEALEQLRVVEHEVGHLRVKQVIPPTPKVESILRAVGLDKELTTLRRHPIQPAV